MKRALDFLKRLRKEDDQVAGSGREFPPHVELRPERAIEFRVQDALGRSSFAERIAGALVNINTGRSSGVIVGITGPWGSGKSSILSLIASLESSRKNPLSIIIQSSFGLIRGLFRGAMI